MQGTECVCVYLVVCYTRWGEGIYKAVVSGICDGQNQNVQLYFVLRDSP